MISKIKATKNWEKKYPYTTGPVNKSPDPYVSFVAIELQFVVFLFANFIIFNRFHFNYVFHRSSQLQSQLELQTCIPYLISSIYTRTYLLYNESMISDCIYYIVWDLDTKDKYKYIYTLSATLTLYNDNPTIFFLHSPSMFSFLLLLLLLFFFHSLNNSNCLLLVSLLLLLPLSTIFFHDSFILSCTQDWVWLEIIRSYKIDMVCISIDYCYFCCVSNFTGDSSNWIIFKRLDKQWKEQKTKKNEFLVCVCVFVCNNNNDK